jgi:hypothetical protein
MCAPEAIFLRSESFILKEHLFTKYTKFHKGIQGITRLPIVSKMVNTIFFQTI